MDLKVFLDRSELTSPARIVAVSGYMADVDRWRLFEQDWQKVLRQHEVERFHMTDFETRHGVYRHWSNPRRIAFIKQLIGIIARRVYVGVGAALNLDDFDRLSEQEKNAVGHPYALLGAMVTQELFRWVDGKAEKVQKQNPGKRVPPQSIYFAFEDGDEGKGELDTLFKGVRTSAVGFRDRISGHSFEKNKDFIPFQCADIAAYETTHQVTRNLGVERRAIRASMLRLLRKIDHTGHFMDLAQLKALATKRMA